MIITNAKKKVMFFLHSLGRGGAERTMINIMNNLNHIKLEVVLFLCTNKNNRYEKILNEKIKVNVLGIDRLRFAFFKLRKVIIKEEPDLLFSTMNPNNIALLISKIFSLVKIPVIIREANNRSASGKVTWLNKKVTRLLYNNFANKVVALSNGVKEDLINEFKIKPEKIEVIYNPVEVEKIKEMATQSIKDVSILNSEKTIISVARLVEQKNYPLLLKAFKKVREKIKCKLLILGTGYLEDELKELSRELGIDKYIVFLGFKDNPYKYMQKSDLFVLSSNWEGFGHVIVEAMASGTPVIATDCKSGPREIIGNSEFGILTPVNNVNALAKEISFLLKNEQEAQVYKEKGLERAKKFTSNKIVKEYESLFLNLLKF